MPSDEDSENGADVDGGDPRTKRPTMQGRPDMEMNVIGWGVFVGTLLVLIPLLPGFFLVWLVYRILGLGGDRRLSWR